MPGPSRALILALALAALAEPQAIGPARPVQLAKSAGEAVIRALQKDRADSEKWLRSDATSYLATIARRDFGDKKTLTIGRAADNDVRIDALAISPHHLRVTVVGDRFHVEGVDPPARFKVNVAEKAADNVPEKNVSNIKRDATLDPSYIQIDRFSLRLSHQRFPAVIVFDPQSPRFKQYKGLRYFPIDLAYRYELPLTPNPKPETVMIMSGCSSRASAKTISRSCFATRRASTTRTPSAGTSTPRSCPTGTTCSTSMRRTTPRAHSRITTIVRFPRKPIHWRSRFARERWTRTTTKLKGAVQ
jgi:hypothetical protein